MWPNILGLLDLAMDKHIFWDHNLLICHDIDVGGNSQVVIISLKNGLDNYQLPLEDRVDSFLPVSKCTII